jgi:coenzyme Q-binding protein COQ10
MPRVRDALNVPFPPEQIFDLVVDIESYPRFVPGWRAVRIATHERKLGGDANRGRMLVDQQVSEKGLRFRFRTEARYRRPLYLRIATTSAPYRYFMLIWRFAPNGQGGTRVGVHMRYRLRAMPLQHVAERHFNNLFDQVVHAFDREARRRYGGTRARGGAGTRRAAGR